ncbi:cyclin-dependent kinase 2-interacting protein-like [Mya arenaria]|nr:cyclin-dependent kinase 2-interacting protein-like [Mya arenaria]
MGPKSKSKSSSFSTETAPVESESFSPVKISVPSPRQQGNLTGSARKLKDGAADIYNQLQKWRSLNTDGVDIVNEIANIKLDKILSKNEDTTSHDLLPEALMPLCDKLYSVFVKMEKVLSRLSGLVEMARGVSELESFNQSDDREHIFFQSWPTHRFAEVFEEIETMYSAELQLKRCIAENICFAADRNTLMFYTASWLHQPHVEPSTDINLESLLLETGHKT